MGGNGGQQYKNNTQVVHLNTFGIHTIVIRIQSSTNTNLCVNDIQLYSRLSLI